MKIHIKYLLWFCFLRSYFDHHTLGFFRVENSHCPTKSSNLHGILIVITVKVPNRHN